MQRFLIWHHKLGIGPAIYMSVILQLVPFIQVTLLLSPLKSKHRCIIIRRQFVILSLLYSLFQVTVLLQSCIFNSVHNGGSVFIFWSCVAFYFYSVIFCVFSIPWLPGRGLFLFRHPPSNPIPAGLCLHVHILVPVANCASVALMHTMC